MKVSDEVLRAALDGKGILRRDATLPWPDPSAGFTVFSQRRDAGLDLAAVERQAAQFFGAKVGLAIPKRYVETFPAEDVGAFVVARGEARGVPCWAYGRARTDDDLRAAEDAEVAMGGGGLGGLAKRCPTVWIVTADEMNHDAALLLAGVFASVALGPILPPGRREILGVRSARERLGV